MTQMQPGMETMRAPAMTVDSRATFIVRTYNHLFGAIVAFTLIEVGIFAADLAEPMTRAMIPGKRWLLVLGAFTGVWTWMMAVEREARRLEEVGYAVVDACKSFSKSL